MTIRSEFDVHILNDAGIVKARAIAETFSTALVNLEAQCGTDGREMAVVRTKLQEAAFFATRAMAVRSENQADFYARITREAARHPANELFVVDGRTFLSSGGGGWGEPGDGSGAGPSP